MANPPARSKEPRTAVRGFLNLAAAQPDFGTLAQTSVGAVSQLGGAGLLYGEDNLVPVLALAAAQQSGTAFRCLERRAEFLEGTGFAVPERDPATGELKNPAQAGTLGDTPWPGHPGKTANDLWAVLCSYGAYNNGAAGTVLYNNGSTIGEVHVVPFASVRKTVNGTYLLNHKFGRKGFRAAATTEHLPFDSGKKTVLAVLRRAKELDPKTKKRYGQPGQMFYLYTSKAGQEDYPLPPQWAGLEAVLADASYSRYELDEVNRGFAVKGMLAFIGQDNDTVRDEDGLTARDRTDEMLRRYTQQGAREQGVERESIMVFDAATKDLVPVWIPMATTVDLKWLSEKKEAIGQEVCRHIGIPPILAGFAKAGQLGAAQEILNAVQLTQDSLEGTRRMLLRGFWRLMPSMLGQVPGQRKPLSFVDPAVLATLTTDEKRALAGYSAATTPAP